MKKYTYLLMVLALVGVGLAGMTVIGCTFEMEANLPAEIEMVGAVPNELTHWLHSQLGLQKNPILISQEWEDHVYILATMGSRSLENGELALTKQTRQEERVSLELVYTYPEGAGESLDIHFMIIRAPRELKLNIDLKDGVKNNDLEGYGSY